MLFFVMLMSHTFQYNTIHMSVVNNLYIALEHELYTHVYSLDIVIRVRLNYLSRNHKNRAAQTIYSLEMNQYL